MKKVIKICNINVALRKDGQRDDRINNYMEIASWQSWLGNNDGEGFIAIRSDGMTTLRSLQKISYNKLRPYNILISHQRYATSGDGINNAHPHEGKYYIIMHNGVISGVGDKTKSDTAYYLDKLEEKYEQTHNTIKTIKEVNKETSGSYSIILYDKIRKKIYYYKNSNTNMYIITNNKWLFMSTNHTNMKIAKEMFNIKNDIYDIGSNKIFEITHKGLIKISEWDNNKTYTTINDYYKKQNVCTKCDYPINSTEHQTICETEIELCDNCGYPTNSKQHEQTCGG